MGDEFTLAMIATTSRDDFSEFVRCEDQFLALFDRYGIVLERRLRSQDEATEIHIIRVPDQAALESYLVDPDRVALLPRLRELDLAQQILRVDDVV